MNFSDPQLQPPATALPPLSRPHRIFHLYQVSQTHENLVALMENCSSYKTKGKGNLSGIWGETENELEYISKTKECYVCLTLENFVDFYLCEREGDVSKFTFFFF